MTCFLNLSYWSSRYWFCDRFCNFEIPDSTAKILSGSRLVLGGGLLPGETFFCFWPVIVPSDVSAISFVKLVPSPGWICLVTSSESS